MRISDWSSDVCSSDLHECREAAARQLPAGDIVDGIPHDQRHRAEQQRDHHRRQQRAHPEATLGRREAVAHRGLEPVRSEEHTSELQSLMRISYAVFCLQKKIHKQNIQTTEQSQYNTQTLPQLTN